MLNKKNLIVRFIYIIYFIFLFLLVTCKIIIINIGGIDNFYLYINNVNWTIEDIKHNRELGYWNYNFKPFETYYIWLTHGVWDGLINNLLGNIVAFIPMGFFEIALSKHRKFWKVVLKCFIIVLSLELFQFITCLGYLDIDDITMNTFGCLLGCLCFNLVSYLYKIFIKKIDE